MLALVVGLRSDSGGKIEIRLADAASATIRIVLRLVMSGQMAKLSFGAEGVSLETAGKAIRETSVKPIGGQVAGQEGG